MHFFITQWDQRRSRREQTAMPQPVHTCVTSLEARWYMGVRAYMQILISFDVLCSSRGAGLKVAGFRHRWYAAGDWWVAAKGNCSRACARRLHTHIKRPTHPPFNIQYKSKHCTTRLVWCWRSDSPAHAHTPTSTRTPRHTHPPTGLHPLIQPPTSTRRRPPTHTPTP